MILIDLENGREILIKSYVAETNTLVTQDSSFQINFEKEKLQLK